MSTANQSTRIAASLDRIHSLPWLLIATLSITASFGTTPVEAADSTWTNSGTGSFSDNASWSAGQPGASDNAIFGAATSGASVQLGTDANTNQTQVDGDHSLQLNSHNYGTGSLDIGTSGGGGSLTVQGSGNINVSNNIAIGNTGSGSLNVQYSGASVSAGDQLKTGASGTLNLRAGNVSAATIDLSQGTTNHSGGTLTATSQLITQAGADHDITGSNGSTASVVLDGATWDLGSNKTDIGVNGNGSLALRNGATLNTGTRVFAGDGGSATISIDGAGSQWNNAHTLEAGYDGNASMSVTNGGRYTGTISSYLYHGATLSVDGADSTFEVDHRLQLEDNVSVSVGNGGQLKDGYAQLFDGSSLSVSGNGSNWNTTAEVWVNGSDTASSVNISDGATASTGGAVYIGHWNNHNGTATVDGSGSSWSQQYLDVGYGGNGTLNVTHGASTTTDLNGYIAYGSGSSGTATVAGTGNNGENASMHFNSDLYVGGSSSSANGTGTLNVQDGGEVNVAGTLKNWDGSTVNLSGGQITAATVDVSEGSFNHSDGTLTATTAFKTKANSTYWIGSSTGGTASVVLDGADWNLNGWSAQVGDGSNGALTVKNGATVNSGYNHYWGVSGGTASVNIDGAGSQINNSGQIKMGDATGSASLSITNGGNYSGGKAWLTNTSLNIDGAGSGYSQSADYFYAADSDIHVGNSGSLTTTRTTYLSGGSSGNQLTVSNGGSFSSTGDVILGTDSASADTTVTVDGTGSTWNHYTQWLGYDNFLMGLRSDAHLNVSNGGSFTARDFSFIGYESGHNATATVGGTGSNGENASMNFNHGLHVGGTYSGVTGTGTVTVQDGGELNASNHLTIWDTSALFINSGGQASTGNLNLRGLASIDGILNATSMSVADGGRLKGSGTVNALTTIGAGAVMAPGNSPGTQTFSSGLTWTDGGTFEWEINDFNGTAGSDPGWDVVNVTGGWDISALSAGGFNIDVMSLMLSNVGGDAANFDHEQNYSFDILSFDSLIGTFSDSLFSIDASGFSNAHSGVWLLSLDNVNSKLMLSYNSVPAPAMPALIVLGLGLVLIRRRAK